MLSGSCQVTNHIKPHLPAHRPQPMGCFCLPVYLKTNQLQRHNAKNRRPLHIAWPALNALSDAMIIKAVIMRLMYYYIRLFTESSISRYVSVMWPLVLQWYCRCFLCLLTCGQLTVGPPPGCGGFRVGGEGWTCAAGPWDGEQHRGHGRRVQLREKKVHWPAFVAPYEKFYFFPKKISFSFSLHKLTFY